jgi:hypothetical protein
LNVETHVNNTAFFYCEASFDPELDLIYMWTFNGKLIDTLNDPHFHVVRAGPIYM